MAGREEISELLQLERHIDLVIPRGSNELVRLIKQQSRGIPVLGHADGVCHVYVDAAADAATAEQVVRDAKCDYPAACNAMETLLVHTEHVKSGLLQRLCDRLHAEQVQLRSGPRLGQQLTFGPPPASSMRVEYSSLACAVELVDSVDQAIDHCNGFGSSHTDVIVTEDGRALATQLDLDLPEPRVGISISKPPVPPLHPHRRARRQPVPGSGGQRLRLPQLQQPLRRRLPIRAG